MSGALAVWRCAVPGLRCRSHVYAAVAEDDRVALQLQYMRFLPRSMNIATNWRNEELIKRY